MIIEIAMASYNAAPYVAQQIDSVLAQTCSDWELVIRDDGSSDGTASVLREYAALHPGKIRLLQDNLGNLGYPANFGHLLGHCHGDYVMICNIDDVWLPEKIEKTLAAMWELEREAGPGVPLLVHTDSCVCDADLNPIAQSLLRHLNRRPNLPLNRLLIENPVFGHTIMINKALNQFVSGFPEGVGNEDWWLALLATAFGRVRFLDEATVLFRRHHGTTSRQVKHGFLNYFGRSLSSHRTSLNRSLRQIETFYKVYGDRLSSSNKKLFEAAVRIRGSNWWMRRYLILRHRIFKTGLVKNLGLLAAI